MHRVTFRVLSQADERGFLHVDRNQPYFMMFDNGDQFRGIGTNIGWEPRRRRNQKHSYDTLFPRIAAQGLNTVRTWMCPWNMPLEWNGRQLGEYDEDALRRLDEMFALAEKSGLYVVLVLGYHGELQTVSGSFPNNDRWKENPYNVVNGGPCETPADFFTNEQAKALYKKRLKMLVARVACQLAFAGVGVLERNRPHRATRPGARGLQSSPGMKRWRTICTVSMYMIIQSRPVFP